MTEDDLGTSPLTSPQGPRFRVQLLGRFGLELNGTELRTDHWPPRARTLFTLLAVASSLRRSRDELIDILWPDTSPEAGWSNLRYTLHLVRRALNMPEPSPVLVEHGWIALNPAFTWEIDLARFQQLARQTGDDRDALERVAQLYTGEPLAEHRYEEWAMPVRTRVQEQWRALCLRLGTLHSGAGSQGEAVRWFERALEDDPLDEEALRGLITALAGQGRRVQALRRFQQFEQLLRAEVDVPPEPETLALVGQLQLQLADVAAIPERTPVSSQPQAAPVTPTYPLSTAEPLVGREAERRIIEAGLNSHESPPTKTRLILLAAEAGMGKTRLLAEVAERARRDGALTLAGGCYESEGSLPFGPMHDALHDYVRVQPGSVLRSQLGTLLPEVARIVPELRARVPDLEEPWSGAPESRQLRLFTTVVQTLERLSSERPLVLLLDDLHWADEGTLELLHFLVRQPGDGRTLIVGAYRSGEIKRSETLDRLLRSAGEDERVRHLSLSPLSRAELTVLLEQRLGDACSPPLVSRLYTRSQGNPFFAVQMLQLLRREGRLQLGTEGWELPPATAIEIPPAVREIVARRLRYLAPEEREALTLGAMLGRDFGYAPLEAMWEGAERELFAALDVAVDAQMLIETEQGYAFQHPLLWEVVYERAPAPRRRFLHERAALTLERLYGDRANEHAALLAHHFVQAGRVHLDRAMRYLILAGDAAENLFAHDEAERHYRTALEMAHERGDTALEAQILEKLGGVMKTVGRYDEALTLLGQAAERYAAAADLEGELRSIAQAGRVHSNRGSYAEGIDSLQQAVSSRGDAVPSEGLAALHVALAFLFFASGRYGEQLSAAEKAAELARMTGSDRLLVQAELVRGYALAWTERRTEFRPVMEGVITLGETTGDLATAALALGALIGWHADAGELALARECAERALAIQQHLGDRSRIAFAHYAHGLVTYWSGDWDAAQTSFERSLELCREIGLSAQAMSPIVGLGLLHMDRGDWETGRRYLEEHTALAEQTGDRRWLHLVETRLAEWEIQKGCAEAARARLDRALDLPNLSATDAALVWVALARACLALEEHSRAAELVAAAIETAEAQDNRRALVEGLQVQGMVLTQQRRWDEARSDFEQVLALTDSKTYPYARARAIEEYACMLLANGNEDGARDRCREALQLFATLGARKDAERAQKMLVQLSQR